MKRILAAMFLFTFYATISYACTHSCPTTMDCNTRPGCIQSACGGLCAVCNISGNDCVFSDTPNRIGYGPCVGGTGDRGVFCQCGQTCSNTCPDDAWADNASYPGYQTRVADKTRGSPSCTCSPPNTSCSATCTCTGGTTQYRCRAGWHGIATFQYAPAGYCTQCPLATFYTDSGLSILARGTNTAGSNATLQTCQFNSSTTFYNSAGGFRIPSACTVN